MRKIDIFLFQRLTKRRERRRLRTIRGLRQGIKKNSNYNHTYKGITIPSNLDLVNCH